ncbi:hypothetical protein BS47DRAFT_1349626 [Hydnum rufescens UP504]|uniref:Uncharacterized protein n=1 Tax=Hydnum rufescens UP504 TaxID=1448309 RepID=A0A9P6ANN3_9AGAM|nr:hypothetical protein BS47DRAFT_1349626 [Hydnum rufescens UP504]
MQDKNYTGGPRKPPPSLFVPPQFGYATWITRSSEGGGATNRSAQYRRHLWAPNIRAHPVAPAPLTLKRANQIYIESAWETLTDPLPPPLLNAVRRKAPKKNNNEHGRPNFLFRRCDTMIVPFLWHAT